MCCIYRFVFLKQKTAYEMRISDWSSDVCSSDLESSWLLETTGRILTHFTGADCRTAFVVTGTADEARQFLGPWADKVLTFADPDRAVVKGLGLNELPAFVQVRGDRAVAAAAEGWDPMEWRKIGRAHV